MYCYHCGYILDHHKLESQKSSMAAVKDVEIDENAQIQYVCPRCGHMIHENMSYEESKELSRASHAQIQRGNNSFATGMCLNSLGLILLVISIIFLLLSNKPSVGFVFNCGEFYVGVVTMIMAVILLVTGIVKTVTGLSTKSHYSKLLRDLNNKTFVQQWMNGK